MYSKLNQFIGKKVELTNKERTTTYNYHNFNYEVTEEELILMDSSPDCKTYIPIDEIKEITNLNADVFKTVVDIPYGNGDQISICCTESKPIYPKCHKCEKEIKTPEESIWHIRGQICYGSHFDSAGNYIADIVHGLKFCDSCIYTNLVGEIPEIKEIGGGWYE